MAIWCFVALECAGCCARARLSVSCHVALLTGGHLATLRTRKFFVPRHRFEEALLKQTIQKVCTFASVRTQMIVLGRRADITMVDRSQMNIISPSSPPTNPQNYREVLYKLRSVLHSNTFKEVLLSRASSLGSFKGLFHGTNSSESTTHKVPLQTKGVKVVTRQDITKGIYRVPEPSSPPRVTRSRHASRSASRKSPPARAI